ncbi:MAG TPA: GtrA family protein [Thermohalobaculum sp.]|nr:GtrA family protein [Thermohalobaculum sp.]
MTARRQVTSFGLVGVLATATHAAVGLTLHDGLGINPLPANLVAFLCALCLSFLGQTRLTFPDRKADTGAFLRFTAVSLLGLGLNQAIVWLVTSVLDRPYWLALATIIATVPAATFLALKFWALRH